MRRQTIKQYLNKNDKNYFKYGVLTKYYGLIGKIFRSTKYLDKSVYYLDKRWDIMMNLLHNQK